MASIRSYTSIKFSLLTALITAGFFIFLFLYLGFNLRQYILEDSKELAKEISRKAAVETEQYFTTAIMINRSMARNVLLIRELGGTREQVRNVLFSNLSRFKSFLGVWTLWEPNSFDSKDHLFAGDEFHNRLGTVGYGYFMVNDSIHKEIMSENDYARPYYSLSKETLKERIVEPYTWSYTGFQKTFFGTSISLPLIERGEFLGVIGIDIDLITLREKINRIRPYGTGFLSLITNTGTLVSHTDTNFLNKNLFHLISDPDSLVFEAISKGLQYTFETKSEFTGNQVFRFFYPINIGNGKPWSIMVEIPIKDATGRTDQLILVAAIILVVGLGLITFLIFTIIDRRRYEKAIISALNEVQEKSRIALENEQNYREVFNSTSEAIFIHNVLTGEILDVNDVALEMYNYSNKDEIVSLNVGNLSLNEEPYSTKNALEFMNKALSEGPQVFEWMSRKSNGDLFWSEVSLKSALISGKKRILAVVRDNDEKKKISIELEKHRNHLEFLVKERTEELASANEELKTINEVLVSQRTSLQKTLDQLKDAQDKLIQSEKMASLGVLAAGIAHELNNPLNFINGGVIGIEKYIHKSYPNISPEIKELILAIKEGVRRSTGIVRSLNHYSSSDTLTKAKCDLTSIIDNCLLILINQTKDRIEVVKEYDDQLELYPCNEGQLHQAILNILTNAVHAINEKGVITIRVNKVKSKIKIVITDNGCGVGKENLKRLTDPFFTTKEPGKGIGLGLSITETIVKDHGGTLKFESELGMGTTVTITLP